MFCVSPVSSLDARFRCLAALHGLSYRRRTGYKCDRGLEDLQ